MTFFKTYDIRGVIDEELNEEIAQRIGKTLGTFIKGKPVVVGHDIREASHRLYKPFMQGLVSTGCTVFAIGEYPSPILMFNAWQRGIHGAIITASHNPAQYTGFKFVDEQGLAFVDEYAELRNIYESQQFISGEGSIEEIDGYTPYLDFCRKTLTFGRKVKVAVECLHASGGVLVPRLFEDLGLGVVGSHCVPKKDFNNERPEPKGDNLNPVGELIVKEGADFGVGLDGDCDRSVMIDERGSQMNGSVASAIFINHLLPKAESKNVVITIDCNAELKQLTEQLGGKLSWSEVGHGFISQEVKKTNAVYGAEMSSHMWFAPLPFSDGFYCALKMAELLSNETRTLSQLRAQVKFAPMVKEYIECGTHEIKEKVKDALVERYSKEYPDAQKTRDGIKFFLSEIEWVLLRKSNNMPELAIVIEAKDDVRLKQLFEQYRQVVEQTIAQFR